MKKFNFNLLILVLLLFTACQKDEVSLQSNLKEQIIAKWQISNIPSTSSIAKNHKFSQKARLKVSQENYIEFFEDNEYLMVLGGIALGGKYKIENEKIILENLNSSLIEVSINADKLSFKIVGEGISENVTAKKADLVNTDPRNKLFCRKWELINFDFEDMENEYYDINDLDKIFVRISQYGTYLNEHKLKDGTSFYIAALWNWHPTKKDYFEYSFNEEPEMKGLVAVKEVTEESLILEEEHDEGYYIFKIPMELKVAK